MLVQAPRPRPELPEHPFRCTIVYQGITLDMEQKPGDTRRGVAPDGTEWSCVLPHFYGEVRDTVGADGDPVDVIVLEHADPFAPWVYVVQAKLPGSTEFDETKAVLGASTQAEALEAFRSMYSAPGFVLGCTRWPIGAWREAMNRPSVTRGPMDIPLSKAVVDVDRMVRLLTGGNANFPSQFAIGDPVWLETEAGSVAGHVVSVSFEPGKVRYSICTAGPNCTTIHDVDSVFVIPRDGVQVEVRPAEPRFTVDEAAFSRF